MTKHDALVYFIAPLVVAFVIGVVAWARSINNRLTTQDKALALLLQEIAPRGGPRLAQLVADHERDLAVHDREIAVLKATTPAGGMP